MLRKEIMRGEKKIVIQWFWSLVFTIPNQIFSVTPGNTFLTCWTSSDLGRAALQNTRSRDSASSSICRRVLVSSSSFWTEPQSESWNTKCMKSIQCALIMNIFISIYVWEVFARAAALVRVASVMRKSYLQTWQHIPETTPHYKALIIFILSALDFYEDHNLVNESQVILNKKRFELLPDERRTPVRCSENKEQSPS